MPNSDLPSPAPAGPDDLPDRDTGHPDPRLNAPGSEGQPGTFDDSPDNLPGSQADPKMPDTKIDPEAPISSARGTA